ncbi:MAG: hypothetical protein AB4352_08760 [Hormoscilla sp.]
MSDISQDEMRDRLGNVDQIRDLLFGKQQRDYETRLNKLESSLSALQQEMRDRLNQLNDTLSTELRSTMYSLEKKIQYISITTNEELTDMRQDLEGKDKNVSDSIDSLNKLIGSQINSVKGEVNQAQEKLEKDIQSLRNEIVDKLEKRLSSLTESKVGRDDLAEILFELCMRVKKNEFLPELEGSGDYNVKADLLLPEQK